MRAIAQNSEVAAILSRLAFQQPAVIQLKTEHIACGPVRHRVELHDLPAARHLQNVAHAAQITLPTVQTSYARERLVLRHVPRLSTPTMQTTGPHSVRYHWARIVPYIVQG